MLYGLYSPHPWVKYCISHTALTVMLYHIHKLYMYNAFLLLDSSQFGYEAETGAWSTGINYTFY